MQFKLKNKHGDTVAHGNESKIDDYINGNLCDEDFWPDYEKMDNHKITATKDGGKSLGEIKATEWMVDREDVEFFNGLTISDIRKMRFTEIGNDEYVRFVPITVSEFDKKGVESLMFQPFKTII